MSRYSMNFASCDSDGFSPKKRTPASPYPSRLNPPIRMPVEGSPAVWAEATPLRVSTASAATKSRAVRIVCMAAS